MSNKIKKITFYCEDIPENKEDISEIIAGLDKTGIEYAIVSTFEAPLTLHIKSDSNVIAACGRTEVKDYLKRILNKKEYYSKINPQTQPPCQ